MNERIKELMTQSGMISESSIPGTVWTTNMSLKTAEKFAELIVRECAGVCESATQKGNPLHLVSLGYSQRVKEHFGVEE